ncbi:MAG: hypothetical protein ACTSWY_05305 [Promethearchaeota archaeon]
MVNIDGGDGSSIENAIVISNCNEKEGVNSEYREVRNRFGNYKLITQSLLNIDNKIYDKLELKILENGKNVEIYFNITEFFGKISIFKQSYFIG